MNVPHTVGNANAATEPRFAPSAILTPISLVRCSTRM